jgi:hypothetical protein
LSKQTSKQGIGKTTHRGIKMNGNNRHFSILILNINGLKAPIKRYKIANWVKK